VIGVITATLAHALRLLFDRIERRRIHFGWLNADTAVPTRRLGTLALWLFAIAMAYPYLPGSNSEAFKGLSVLVGVMVSLGASGLVGQAASGFIVTYLGVIRSGDYVKVADTEGTVDHIGIFTTRIITVFAESISVPNVLILGNQLLNYSRSPGTAGVVLRAKVTIGYGVGWQEVHALLLASVVDDPALRHDPAPYVLQRALSDFYVEYELCAHLIDPARRIPVLSGIQARILDLARARGIQLLSPHWMANPPEIQRPVPT
jgi:small-conductance mechanosensitive channel